MHLLYTGIWSAVSPVCLECLFAQAVVRDDKNFVVFFFHCICSLFDALCCKNETIWPREDRMKTSAFRVCLSSLISWTKNVGYLKCFTLVLVYFDFMKTALHTIMKTEIYSVQKVMNISHTFSLYSLFCKQSIYFYINIYNLSVIKRL